ncbi:MAG: hypothetical protein HY744_18875 [Deltaproteobacteria bacterium]|nr:hypothetical protein [Deltaproteobacteria bacterium]
MQATTIKLTGPLINRLKALKPADQTLTGLVRSILEAEIHRRQQQEAARGYMELLRAHPEEAEAMDLWAAVPLDHLRRPRRRR